MNTFDDFFLENFHAKMNFFMSQMKKKMVSGLKILKIRTKLLVKKIRTIRTFWPPCIHPLIFREHSL